MSTNTNWAFSLFGLAIKVLENKGMELSFWENEENWASISFNNKTAGYIWRKYPLIILEKNIALAIKEHLKDVEAVCYIEVESLGVDLFKIEDDKLVKNYFDDLLNFDSFTMDDLWFQTNSI